MDDSRSFLLEEYKALRKEIEIYLSEVRSQERYLLVGVGAIWAWLISNRTSDHRAWSLPILLTIAVGIRALAIDLHFSNLKSYIAIIEKDFHVTGWDSRKRSMTFGVVNLVLLPTLLLFTILGCIYGPALVRALPPLKL